MIRTAFLLAAALAAPALAAPPVTIIAPKGTRATTPAEQISVVGRTDAALVTTATIAGVDVPVFGNGVFVRDGVPVTPGFNSVPVTLFAADGTTAARTTVQVTRVAPEPPVSLVLPSRPLRTDSKSIQPAQNVALSSGEILEVSFRGASGNRAEFQLAPLPWIPMGEVLDPLSGEPTGVYRASITMPELPADVATDETSQPITVRLTASTDVGTTKAETLEPVLARSPGRVALWRDGGPVRLLRVSDPIAQIRYGLTDVRLGGPYLTSVPRGTILHATGRRGPYYKISLTPALDAWVHASEVESAPPGTPLPHLEFAGMTIFSNEEGDRITIPYAAPIPFAVNVDPIGAGERPTLDIDLYGAHQAVTWITHRNPGELIHRVTPEQVGTRHLRLRAELTSGTVWGYKTEVTTSALIVTLRRPPAIAPAPASPLSGLTIAVNAGHGGREGGASGLTGAREADVTLAISRALAEELAAAGARPVLTRNANEAVGITRRAQLAMEANADLFVSIHSNSSGTAAGYLTTSGTSTFYKYPFNHELASLVQEKILERTGLPNFGTVGNFNYGPIRMLTWMPAILVETAFISNPREEAQLTDPAFQKEMARAVREGLEEYVRRSNYEL